MNLASWQCFRNLRVVQRSISFVEWIRSKSQQEPTPDQFLTQKTQGCTFKPQQGVASIFRNAGNSPNQSYISQKILQLCEMSFLPLFPVSFILPRVPGGFVFSLLYLRASVANFLPLILCLSALIATTDVDRRPKCSLNDLTSREEEIRKLNQTGFNRRRRQ